MQHGVCFSLDTLQDAGMWFLMTCRAFDVAKSKSFSVLSEVPHAGKSFRKHGEASVPHNLALVQQSTVLGSHRWRVLVLKTEHCPQGKEQSPEG